MKHLSLDIFIMPEVDICAISRVDFCAISKIKYLCNTQGDFIKWNGYWCNIQD